MNSHISTNGNFCGPPGTSSLTGRKLDSSPLKGSRRKKNRHRKPRLNTGTQIFYNGSLIVVPYAYGTA